MNKKILIVDDEPGIVRLLALRLQAKGHETIEAYDGIQCCIVAEEEVPDLILLDIKMPILNGIGAFEELLKLEVTKDIPVLFMTAYPTSQVKDQVLKMGAKGCISKPFISEDFEQTVDQALNKYNIIEHQEIKSTFVQ
ncbi:MAG: response regulator [Candidatus Neomarinimicrobiota bacterium]